jgi:hypothetical protein
MEVKNADIEKILNYHCPRYEELPDSNVFMDNLLSILENYLAPFESLEDEKLITSTMINNYVKQKVIPSPQNKRYNKTHIMYLIFLGILKSVLSINEISFILKRQTEEYPIERAYNFFAIELENALKVTFGSRDFAQANSEKEKTPLSKIARSALISLANRVYVKYNIYS